MGRCFAVNSENNEGLYRPRTTRYEPTPQERDLVNKWSRTEAASVRQAAPEAPPNGDQRHTFPPTGQIQASTNPSPEPRPQHAPPSPPSAAAESGWHVEPDATEYRGADELNSSSLLKPRHAAP